MSGPHPSSYRKLWSATAISSLGDGMMLAALPLLAASLTRDPAAVAAVAFAEALPWIGLPLLAGALVDRFDRRHVLIVTDVVRLLAMAILGVGVLMGWASLPLLLAVAFVVGAGEAPFDAASQAMIPTVTAADRLERANAQLAGVKVAGFQLVGPALGGAVFAASAALPLLLNAASFAVAVALVGAMRGTHRAPRAAAAPRQSIGRDLREGLGWLLANRLLRRLALVHGGMNIVVTAAFSMLVLFALETLDVSETGYALILSAAAVGGVAGSVLVGPVVRVLGRGSALTAAVALTGLCFVAVSMVRSAWLVGSLLSVFSACAMVWHVSVATLRQELVPNEILGRVTSAYATLGYGTLPLGAVIGGAIGAWRGPASCFLFGGLAMLALATCVAPVASAAGRTPRRASRRAQVTTSATAEHVLS